MTFGSPYSSDLLGMLTVPASKTGANTTKTALATIVVPANMARVGSVFMWFAGGTITLNTADRILGMSVELGSFQMYNTNHSRSGLNYGAFVGPNCTAVVAGAVAGNITVPGIESGTSPAVDKLVSVIRFNAGVPTNLTSEFTVSTTVANTINNTGGTNTTGSQLLVTWGRQFIADGSSTTARDFSGYGYCVVETGGTAAARNMIGGGFMHVPNSDQGGPPTPSAGFDTDGANTGLINSTTSLNFGFYAAWGNPNPGSASDICTLNLFNVQHLGYLAPGP